MPVAERPSRPVRGQKTICIPCSQQQYERAVDDPERFRKLPDRQIEATPELFPPEIRRGYRMKDLYTSRKTGRTLRRIELHNLQCYPVRPCFLMPYLSGHTAEVQAPLVCFLGRWTSGHNMGMEAAGRHPFGPLCAAVEKRGPPPPSSAGIIPNSHLAARPHNKDGTRRVRLLSPYS